MWCEAQQQKKKMFRQKKSFDQKKCKSVQVSMNKSEIWRRCDRRQKKAAFFTFCLYFSLLSFYPPLSSFVSLLPFRQANVSIRFNFISVFLSAFDIFSLSFAFSPGQCFYSLQFYFCLSIRFCHLFSLFCLFARPMFLFPSILFMSFKNTNGTRRKTTMQNLYFIQLFNILKLRISCFTFNIS